MANYISLHIEEKCVRVGGVLIIRKWLTSYLKQCGIKSYFIRVLFVPSSRIERLNTTFLNHEYSTDIITFDLSESKTHMDAELYICPSVVYENSLSYSSNYKYEMLRVIIHGLLHLTGYNDKTIKEKKEMRDVEDYWIREVKDVSKIYFSRGTQ